MPDARNEAPLLFCPFCRECFEGERECPAHELPLVAFDALPREEPDTLSHDQVLSILDPRFGRGFIMAGALISLLGFYLPVLSIRSGDQARLFRGFEAAATRAPNLWTVPFVALMFVWILMRRRTPLAMLGARLAGVVFALAPLFSLSYTVLKVRQGAERWSAEMHRTMEVSIEHGVFVIALGALLLLLGSIRFGALPLANVAPSDPEPHRPTSRRGRKLRAGARE